MTALYHQQIDQALGGAHGASPAQIERGLQRLVELTAQLKAQADRGDLPMFALAQRTDDLPEIERIAKHIESRFERLVVFGTGGSSLGGQALTALRRSSCQAARLVFAGNVDPVSMEHLFHQLDLERTAFLIISKSGTTVETLAQLLVLLDKLRARNITALAERCFVITMPGENPLRTLAQTHGMTLLEHDPKLGGRFSVFSSVGLIPAAVSGLDIRALCEGAAQVLRATWAASVAAPCAPMLGAALHAALLERGTSVSVLMPYCDRLAEFGTWFRQTWAESIGKEGKGSTPVRALGAIDQHSQLQLYLDGPRDKFFTFLLLDNEGKGARIAPELAHLPALEYLHGHTLGDIFNAQQQGTLETLVRHGCPLRVIRMPALDERTLGALLMHFMLETVMTAHLLGVNAFDQPAVEESKRLAREYLAKSRLTEAV